MLCTRMIVEVRGGMCLCEGQAVADVWLHCEELSSTLAKNG